MQVQEREETQQSYANMLLKVLWILVLMLNMLIYIAMTLKDVWAVLHVI